MLNIPQYLAAELNTSEKNINATIQMLDDGATVPFIARYRKEITGGLDDVKLRQLEERLNYLRELEDRKKVVLKSMTELEKLTPELENNIVNTDSKTELEDLYRPFMPKRRTKAQIAREAGLEPLAIQLLEDQTLDPEATAIQFINAKNNINEASDALEGAKQILMETFADDPALSTKLREYLWENAQVQSKVIEGKEEVGSKFTDYFDMVEPVRSIPSHRALAIYRGRNEAILQMNLVIEEEGEIVNINQSTVCTNFIIKQFSLSNDQAASQYLKECARWAWRVKLSTRLDTEIKLTIKDAADLEAINVFSTNLHDLLMAAPAGPRTTMGLDPGFRSGVKVAIVDNTGKYIANDVIYPHQPQNQYAQAMQKLAVLAKQYNVELISIGNGTASRETERLAAELIAKHPELRLQKIVVSEAGASVYSASETAGQEFPDLDVTVRGAISIARRLQDPLAELVKIEPKAIGVGQYQHDVNQSKLGKKLGSVVENCVNAVGVDVNTASAALLSFISGLNKTLASNIVKFRDENGKFSQRKDLKKVPRLGEKAFEQCAGFLRIMDGKNPLDASTVHPEAYPLVEQIVSRTEKEIKQIIGNAVLLKNLKIEDYVDEKFGRPTVQDILNELEKPGRDPRPEFKTAQFKEGVETMAHLEPNMILEGVVTNITNFGAFVDIGVHQDGLVHISAIADKFVDNPRSVVKAGDIVKVKVLEVDIARKRISLSMRLADTAATKTTPMSKKPEKRKSQPANTPPVAANSAFALAFNKAKEGA